MAKANVNVKIDAEVKALATQLLRHMGIDQTTAIEMFYRQIIKENALPSGRLIIAPTLLN